MLQQSGWSEGEPLGAGVVRRARPSRAGGKTREYLKGEDVEHPIIMEAREVKLEGTRARLKEETKEIKLDSDDEVTEVQKIDIIDLTLSDSEDEDIAEEVDDTEPLSIDIEPSASTHNPRALLTPLPTVLKSDRLGLGLKAKTEGPYRASKKRVTHGAAALAAHTRANEEMRRMKALMGRGTRGLARLAKAESERRQRLLADLKGD